MNPCQFGLHCPYYNIDNGDRVCTNPFSKEMIEALDTIHQAEYVVEGTDPNDVDCPLVEISSLMYWLTEVVDSYEKEKELRDGLMEIHDDELYGVEGEE